MIRFKPPKQEKIQINQRQRNQILFTVKHNMLPVWLAAFIAAVKDTIEIDRETVKKIIVRFSNYLRWHEEKLININDLRKSVEKDLGESLDKIARFE